MIGPDYGTVDSSTQLEKHRQERLEHIERIGKEAPEHHRPDIDRLWELVKEAANS